MKPPLLRILSPRFARASLGLQIGYFKLVEILPGGLVFLPFLRISGWSPGMKILQ